MNQVIRKNYFFISSFHENYHVTSRQWNESSGEALDECKFILKKPTLDFIKLKFEELF